MAEAETALAPPTSPGSSCPRAARPGAPPAAVVGGLAVVGVTTGVAVASQGACRATPSTPVKRAIESAHTGLSVGEGGKGSTMLANARTASTRPTRSRARTTSATTSGSPTP